MDLISSCFASLYPVDGLQTEGMGTAQKYGGKASERGALEFTVTGLRLGMSVPRAGSSALSHGGDLPSCWLGRQGELSTSHFLLKIPPELEPRLKKGRACLITKTKLSSSRFPSLYKGNQTQPSNSSCKALSKASQAGSCWQTWPPGLPAVSPGCWRLGWPGFDSMASAGHCSTQRKPRDLPSLPSPRSGPGGQLGGARGSVQVPSLAQHEAVLSTSNSDFLMRCLLFLPSLLGSRLSSALGVLLPYSTAGSKDLQGLRGQQWR